MNNNLNGFSIIGAVITLLIVGAIALVLMSMQGRVWIGAITGTKYQAATIVQQQCLERVLSVRGQLGYPAVTTSVCTSLPSVQGISASVSISQGSLPACITNTTTCDTLSTSLVYKDVTITAAGINPVTARLFRY